MGNIKQRANDARKLLNDPVFEQICADIRNEAVGLFLDPKSSIEALSLAHERIRAVQTFLDAIETRLNDELIADHNEKGKAP